MSAHRSAARIKSDQRKRDIVMDGMASMALLYHTGFVDAQRKNPSRYLEVHPRMPEDRMMYAKGFDDAEAGMPCMLCGGTDQVHA